MISDCEQRSEGGVHWPHVCVLHVAWFEHDEKGVGVCEASFVMGFISFSLMGGLGCDWSF